NWMLAAQHTYFAGLLAHCAVKAVGAVKDAGAVKAVGAVTAARASGAVRAPGESDHADVLRDTITVLEEASAIGGGGLLAFFVRHAVATASGDRIALDEIAREAEALGMLSTAADIRLM